MVVAIEHAVRSCEELESLDNESRLLEGLTLSTVEEGFAKLKMTAGEGPLTCGQTTRRSDMVR